MLEYNIRTLTTTGELVIWTPVVGATGGIMWGNMRSNMTMNIRFPENDMHVSI